MKTSKRRAGKQLMANPKTAVRRASPGTAAQAEQALRRIEERLRSLVTATAQIIWITNAQGEVTHDIPLWRAYTGQSERGVKGWGWIEALHPDDREATRVIWSRAVEARTIYETDYRIRRHDGIYRYFVVRGAPVLEADGQIREWVGTCTDITDLRQAEEELKDSHEYLEKLNNSLQEVIFTVKRPERVIVYVNNSMETVFGYKPAECIGKNTQFLYSSQNEYHMFGEQLDSAIARGQEALHTELMMRRRNGEVFPAEITATVFRTDSEVTQVVSVVRDITLRRQGEEALRRSEATLAAAQRIAHVGNWDWDIATGKLAWSDEVYRIFGLSPQQFGATYEKFLSYVHPDDREFVEQSVSEALYESRPYSIDHRIVLPDGTVRVVHEDGEVTFDTDGGPLYMVGIVHDITELKRAEDELRALSHNLVELQETERRAIGRELHDQIGQSLTVLQLLLAQAAKSARESTGNGLSEAQALVKELMAQVRQMSLDLRPAMLDDLGLLPTLLWYFERFSSQTGIRINFEHSSLQEQVAPHVNLAAYRIIQEALTNVARHACVNQVTIRAWTDEETIHVRIEDQGAGFIPETLIPGTSSGLSGMRERARALGGRVTIESTPGVGTIITVELPLSATGEARKCG